METVIECTKVKEWNGKPIYKIGLSDGRGGESFNNIPTGTPVSDLEINNDPQYGLKIKLKKQAGSFGGYQGKRSGNESFALSYSKDLVVGGKVDLKDILTTADKLYKWLEAKKAPDEVQKPKPEQKVSDINSDLPF
jgi:hypothetical protein